MTGSFESEACGRDTAISRICRTRSREMPNRSSRSSSVFGLSERCCTTLSAEDSHRESNRLDRRHEQAITCPLPHYELVQLHRLTEEAWIFADLAAQGDDLARTA